MATLQIINVMSDKFKIDGISLYAAGSTEIQFAIIIIIIIIKKLKRF